MKGGIGESGTTVLSTGIAVSFASIALAGTPRGPFMTKPTLLILAGFFSLCAAAAVSAPIPQAAREPLGAATLLALVTGNALPENVVAAIETDGLAFKPTEEYRRQLREAGGDGGNTEALGKVPAGSKDATDQSQDGPDMVSLELGRKAYPGKEV